MPKLTIEFDSQEALEGFATWLCESGEQEYWSYYEDYGNPEENPPIVSFNYHPEDESFPEDDERRYGKFLEGNVIKTEEIKEEE
jgi:hypothetical protein